MISLQGSGLHALSNSSRFGLSTRFVHKKILCGLFIKVCQPSSKKKNGDDFCNVELSLSEVLVSICVGS